MARSRYEILHVELDLVVDVARRDLGQPHMPDLWQLLLAAKPIRPGALQCLVCLDQGRGTQWVYLREHPIRHPVHFTTTIKTHGSAPKSPAHSALQERVAATAQLHGLTAEVESRSADGTHISDVLIRGGAVPLGFEAQLSPEDRQKTRRRNAARVRSGIQPMWVGTNLNAAFVDAVPWAAIPRQDAVYIAAGHELRITGGVQRLMLERCGFDGSRCPRRNLPKGSRYCSGRHLYPELIRPNLDELVVGAATGTYRSLEIRGTRRTNFWWLTADDYERWINDRGLYDPTQASSLQRSGSPTHHLPAAPTAHIVATEGPHYTPSPGRCGAGLDLCGAPARPYPCGWRCEEHKP